MATHENLVKEVLDELLLERSGGEQAVEISSEQFGHEVAAKISQESDRTKAALRTCPPMER
jgi:hypothetical protein